MICLDVHKMYGSNVSSIKHIRIRTMHYLFQ